MKKQENVTHTQEKRQSIETNHKVTQVLELTKILKQLPASMFKTPRENKLIINKGTNCKFQQRNKNIKKSQMEIEKLKNSLSKIKNSLYGLNSRMEKVLKIDQKIIPTKKQREKY